MPEKTATLETEISDKPVYVTGATLKLGCIAVKIPRPLGYYDGIKPIGYFDDDKLQQIITNAAKEKGVTPDKIALVFDTE